MQRWRRREIKRLEGFICYVAPTHRETVTQMGSSSQCGCKHHLTYVVLWRASHIKTTTPWLTSPLFVFFCGAAEKQLGEEWKDKISPVPCRVCGDSLICERIGIWRWRRDWFIGVQRDNRMSFRSIGCISIGPEGRERYEQMDSGHRLSRNLCLLVIVVYLFPQGWVFGAFLCWLLYNGILYFNKQKGAYLKCLFVKRWRQ